MTSENTNPFVKQLYFILAKYKEKTWDTNENVRINIVPYNQHMLFSFDVLWTIDNKNFVYKWESYFTSINWWEVSKELQEKLIEDKHKDYKAWTIEIGTVL